MPPTEKRNIGSYEDAPILKAIQLMISECFSAMAFANAMGGMRTEAWAIIFDHKVDEIFAEAKRRGILSGDIKASIGPATVATCWAKDYLV